MRPSTNQNTSRGPSSLWFSSASSQQQEASMFCSRLQDQAFLSSRSSLICRSTLSSSSPTQSCRCSQPFLRPLRFIRRLPTIPCSMNQTLCLTVWLQTMTRMKNKLSLMRMKPTNFSVSMEPSMLWWRSGFQPRQSSRRELMMEGAVDSCPWKLVSHLAMMRQTRQPTVVKSMPILGRESQMMAFFCPRLCSLMILRPMPNAMCTKATIIDTFILREFSKFSPFSDTAHTGCTTPKFPSLRIFIPKNSLQITPQQMLIAAISLNIGPSFSATHTPSSSSPCPKSLNIIPKRIGTVASMNTEGIIQLCLGIENSSVRILASNRQGSLGMMVLGLVLPCATGKIETVMGGSVSPAGMWKVKRTWLEGSPTCLEWQMMQTMRSRKETLKMCCLRETSSPTTCSLRTRVNSCPEISISSSDYLNFFCTTSSYSIRWLGRLGRSQSRTSFDWQAFSTLSPICLYTFLFMRHRKMQVLGSASRDLKLTMEWPRDLRKSRRSRMGLVSSGQTPAMMTNSSRISLFWQTSNLVLMQSSSSSKSRRILRKLSQFLDR